MTFTSEQVAARRRRRGQRGQRRERGRRGRRGRLAITISVLAVLALVGWAVTAGWHALFKPPTVVSSCQVVGESTGTVYPLDPEQTLNASIIADVALRRALPERAVLVALATAQQESKLYNLSYGDADSLGLFQQRTTQGWGTRQQIMTPTYAAGAFYDALIKVPNWQSMSVADAAQAVQRSAYPELYAQWTDFGTAYAAALTGETSGRLTCRLAHPGLAVGTPPAAASAVTSGLSADLDVVSPSVTTDAKTATITVTGLSAAASGDDATAIHRTSTVAAWAVAHAATLGITDVVAGDQEWRPDRDGWHPAGQPAAADSVVMTVTIG